MNETNKQRDKKTKNKNKIKHIQVIQAMQLCNPCKLCIHAKNDLNRSGCLNEPKVMPKWAQGA